MLWNFQMPGADRGNLLNIVANVCQQELQKEEKDQRVDEDLSRITINLAINEMTATKEIHEEWQSGAEKKIFLVK